MAFALWPQGPIKQIRSLISRDLVAVKKIYKENPGYTLDDGNLILTLGQKSSLGIVAEYKKQVRGFTEYKMNRSELEIPYLFMTDAFDHVTLATEMVAKLTRKMIQYAKEAIVLKVWESDLFAQVFFRGHNFIVSETLENHLGSGRNACVMRLKNPYWNSVTTPPSEYAIRASDFT